MSKPIKQIMYAWLDYKDNYICHVYGSKVQVEVCFGGSSVVKSKSKEGKIIKVEVKEIRRKK